MAYISFQPNDYFNAQTWTGTGASQNITGNNFSPSFAWIKALASGNHHLFDQVRGVQKALKSNNDTTEDTNAAYLTAFNSDGYTLGGDGGTNDNGYDYRGWNWRANGQGSSNTDGSINTTYTSANTTSGFSICSYTGTGSNATIGHGLGAVPKMIIVKNLTNANAWSVYHASLGATKYLALNESDVAGTASDRWQDTTPTSSVFSIGTNANQGGSYNYVAYCFAEKKGFSKFGQYNGVGATTGQFVYTGFKPAFVMTKIATTGGNDTGGWVMMDNKSYPNNLSNSPVIFANLSNAQSDSYNGEIFSNGFRFNANSVTVNGSGNSYIYMAFAEEPLVSSNGVPATAR